MVIFLISASSSSWTKPPYQCRTCGYLTTEYDEMDNHQQTTHGLDYIAFCIECGKGFKSLSGFKIHKKMHEEKNDSYPKCYICGRRCASQSRLAVHMRSHSEIKPFACSHCDKSYKHEKDLRDHKCRATN